MNRKKCLFLGYSSKNTKIIGFLRKKKIHVIENLNRKINIKKLNKYNFIISFGYRKIIGKNIINNLKRPIINLHISYLPYNRGVYPNLNSFINKTPKGVTIHEIDNDIDTGKIIYQKKLNLKIKKTTTFEDVYYILRDEIEKLFIKNYLNIINFKYKAFKQKKIKSKKTFKHAIDWNQSIKLYLKNIKN